MLVVTNIRIITMDNLVRMRIQEADSRRSAMRKTERGFFPLRAYALTLSPIGFALRNVQTHISK